MQGQALPARVRWPVAGGLAALGSWAIVGGLSRLTGMMRAIDGGADRVAPDSAMLAVPLLGIALVLLGILVALPPRGVRSALPGALFALFLLAGALAIGALVAGPWLVERTMTAKGYRLCTAQTGIRVEQSRWVRGKAPCRTEPSGNFPD